MSSVHVLQLWTQLHEILTEVLQLLKIGKEVWFYFKEDFFSVNLVMKMQPSFELLKWARQLLEDVVLPYRRVQQDFAYFLKFCKQRSLGRNSWNVQTLKYLEETGRCGCQINAPLAWVTTVVTTQSCPSVQSSCFKHSTLHMGSHDMFLWEAWTNSS